MVLTGMYLQQIKWNEKRITLNLRTIMGADTKGYSTLMADDEVGNGTW